MKKLYLLLSLSLSTGLLHAQNNALSFDGTDDYVDCGNSASLNANTIRTMEGWVKFNSLTGDREIFSKSKAGYGMEVLLYNNALSVYCMNGANYSFIQYPASNLQTGVWYHIAFSWNGTKETMRLYVNGVAVGTRTDGPDINAGGVSNTASGFRIGQWADPSSRPFNGLIDEVRIWNVQRTAAEIKAGMYATPNSASGLVAYYGANEGTGAILANVTSTTGLNGTLVNGTSWISSPVQYSSNALHFDGVDDQMIAPANPLFDLITGTVECWIKPGAMNYNGCFAGNRGNADTRYSFHINTTNNTIGIYNGSSYGSISYPFVTGQWYHVAFVCNGTSTSIYINGLLAGSVATAFRTTVTGQPFIVGIAKRSVSGDMEPFLGEIDEVRLWNTQRTQTELQTYKDKSLTGSEAGLVALYTFNEGVASGNNAGLVTVTDLTVNNNHGTLSNLSLSGTSSNFTAHSMVVLPVQLTTFTAVRNKSDVALQWQTATERNSRQFVVERSVDGLQFTSIGTVQATGQTAQHETYSFSDLNPQNGTAYYRLRIVDRDGAFSFSPVRTVRWNGSRSLTCIADGPGNAVLRLENGSNESYSISDFSGRMVVKGRLVQGQARINSLPSGVYVATAGEGAEALSVRFMVSK